jgi:hypothetical protein
MYVHLTRHMLPLTPLPSTYAPPSQVLDTIREIHVPEAVRSRLAKLCASELAGVQNVPAYLYTLLSKRGKTAKQAAMIKQTSELHARLGAISYPQAYQPAGGSYYAPRQARASFDSFVMQR